MKNIFKLSLLLLAVSALAISCADDEEMAPFKPLFFSQGFELEQAGFGSNEVAIDIEGWSNFNLSGPRKWSCKEFDDNQFARAGFVYHASQSVKDGSLQLPARFIADELASILPVWLGTNMQDLTMLYVTGNGVGWDANMSMIQAQLGLPLHKAEERLTSGIFGGSQEVCESGLAALWYLSKQVRT